MAQLAGDARLVAMVEQNLGVIASMRGDVPRALRHYRTSLAGYRALGLDHYVANLLNDIGLAYADLDAVGRRREHLSRGARAVRGVRRRQHGADGRGQSCRDAYCPRRLRRRPGRLRACAPGGAAAERRARSERGATSTGRHRARARGELDEAEEHLRVAFDSATRREDLLLAAETAREQAELFRRWRGNRDTLQSLSRRTGSSQSCARSAISRTCSACRPPRDAVPRRRDALGARTSSRRTSTRSATASASPTTLARWRATSASTT